MDELENIKLPDAPSENQYIKNLHCDKCGGPVKVSRLGCRPGDGDRNEDLWDIKCTRCGRNRKIITSVPVDFFDMDEPDQE